MSKLNMNLTNGSLVTIQMVANGVRIFPLYFHRILSDPVCVPQGDGNLYQCADLILIEGYTAPSNETCANDVSLASNATATATPSLGQSASASMTMGSATTSASAAASSGSTSGATRDGVVGSFLAVALAAAGLSVVV
jgi:hypothetical protein